MALTDGGCASIYPYLEAAMLGITAVSALALKLHKGVEG